MSYYLEKVTLSGTASSSKAWLTATSTKSFCGYIAGMYYTTDATNPLTAGSSSIVYIRSESTTGRIICRSSSGMVGVARWIMPQHNVHRSTKWDSVFASTVAGKDYPANARLPVVGEKLVMVKIAGATSAGGGSTEGLSLTIFIEGVCP